jgi:hypothetical protein
LALYTKALKSHFHDHTAVISFYSGLPNKDLPFGSQNSQLNSSWLMHDLSIKKSLFLFKKKLSLIIIYKYKMNAVDQEASKWPHLIFLNKISFAFATLFTPPV